MQGICLQCKAKQTMVDERTEVINETGRRVIDGKCEICGFAIRRVIGRVVA